MRRYEISVGEPWDFEGPDGQNRVLVESLGIVAGPKEANWSPTYLLLRVQNPFIYRNESVHLLVACPRYKGVTIESLAREGGTAGIARVRPNVQVTQGIPFDKNDVEYIIIGGLNPVT